MGRALRLWRMLAASALLVLSAPAAWAAACLDEAQWQTLQQQSEVQPALLYVWSPRMVLSAVHADQVQTVARQEGLRMVPVHAGAVHGIATGMAITCMAITGKR